jgi:NAD kinase
MRETDVLLTSYTREELSGKDLDMGTRERCEAVDFEKVKNALAVQVGDDANVISIVEALPQVDTFVPVVTVILSKSGEYAQFNPRGISVLLDRADDLDSAASALCAVVSLDDFPECALPK